MSLQELQLVQQNLEQVTLQKQQLHTQLVEIESALTSISSDKTNYRIIGKIMVTANSEDLIKELTEKKEVISLRLKNFIDQEKKLQENLLELQKKVFNERSN